MSGSGTGSVVVELPDSSPPLTRAQIKTAVNDNTGRGTEKATLIERLCNEALKVALSKHPFRQRQIQLPDVAITENAVSVDLAAVLSATLVHIATARIVDSTGTTSTKLTMKDQAWWDKFVLSAVGNTKGWPEFGHRYGTTIQLDRPANAGMYLRAVITQQAIFTDDSTVCPIAFLDTFVVQYVTAFVFLSVEDQDKFVQWKRQALGPLWDEGKVGGTLLHAIESDKSDLSEEYTFERSPSSNGVGMSITNLDPTHSDFGNARSWY